MREPLYSIGTWDGDAQAYTPQTGLTVPCINVPWRNLLTIYRELRAMGYSCTRNPTDHDSNDPYVLIERTDGQPFDGRR